MSKKERLKGIYVFKVEIPSDGHMNTELVDLISDIEGVEEVFIDNEQGEVRVEGKVAPGKVSRRIGKLGIDARIVEFRRPSIEETNNQLKTDPSLTKISNSGEIDVLSQKGERAQAKDKKRYENAATKTYQFMNQDILSSNENATSSKPKKEKNDLELSQSRFVDGTMAEPRDATDVVDSFKVMLESAFHSETKKNDGASTFVGSGCCIYRVDKKFHEFSYSAYIPDLVSIGPIHRGKGNLPAMEQYKLLYLNNLLTRLTTTTSEWSSILKECVESMKSIEEEVRDCYSESINLSSNEFVEMIVVDGLFIMELFRKNAGEVKIDTDDPLFDNTTCNLLTLVHDLLLLENQLPMIVLNQLITLPKLRNKLHDSSITTLALKFFNHLMPREKEVLEVDPDCEGKHLLDLLGKIFLPSPSHSQTANNSWKSIPTAMELKRAGVKFKKGSTKDNFLDIKFSDGMLEIPPMIIQDKSASLLRNLLAFEQCSGYETYMTSYVILMKSIINSTSDVGFLRDQGIITNFLGDDEDFYDIFNELSCGVNTQGNFYYSELCDQVNEHVGWVSGETLSYTGKYLSHHVIIVFTLMLACFWAYSVSGTSIKVSVMGTGLPNK